MNFIAINIVYQPSTLQTLFFIVLDSLLYYHYHYYKIDTDESFILKGLIECINSINQDNFAHTSQFKSLF